MEGTAGSRAEAAVEGAGAEVSVDGAGAADASAGSGCCGKASKMFGRARSSFVKTRGAGVARDFTRWRSCRASSPKLCAELVANPKMKIARNNAVKNCIAGPAADRIGYFLCLAPGIRAVIFLTNIIPGFPTQAFC